ncbi:MAG: cytochrome ubiquinol oxidase subunit I [Acidobacteriota bacterium]|jgi:mono/diheme cytochrome c family protein
MDYPIWDLAFGGGVLIGIVAIAHVLVSHFAVGGGIAMALVETLAVRRKDAALRQLAYRSSWILILVSTVFGAITGVGIWFTIGLIHPTATSALIRTFVWGWAIEWVFFILEVATAVAYVATWNKVRPRTHLLLIWLYAFAAFMSLVVIQGIISYMLTPGRWLETKAFWDGFLNPTYVPGLVMRTGICFFLAGAYMAFAALREQDVDARGRLVRLMASFQVVGILVAYGGYRWWEVALPEPIRALFLGASPKLAALAATRSFLLWALTAYLVLVLFALVAPRLQRWPVTAVALIAAFAFFGGYERLREGARKPYIIRDHMFSNGVLVSDIERHNREGILAHARWAAREDDGSLEGKGRAVFRAQCASCHTLDGYLSIRRLLASADAAMVDMILEIMHEQGNAYAGGALPDTTTLDYPAMPPFVGTKEERRALGVYLTTLVPAHVAEVRHGR